MENEWKNSNVRFGLEENCRPKSIVDKLYFLTCLTALRWPELGQCRSKVVTYVVRSGWVHICSQLIIPSHDCILSVRGVWNSGEYGIVSTGRPEQNRVINGDSAFDDSISSMIAVAYPSWEMQHLADPLDDVFQSIFILRYYSALLRNLIWSFEAEQFESSVQPHHPN